MWVFLCGAVSPDYINLDDWGSVVPAFKDEKHYLVLYSKHANFCVRFEYKSSERLLDAVEKYNSLIKLGSIKLSQV